MAGVLKTDIIMDGTIEREHGALGGLFQQIIQDMKVGMLLFVFDKGTYFILFIDYFAILNRFYFVRTFSVKNRAFSKNYKHFVDVIKESV